MSDASKFKELTLAALSPASRKAIDQQISMYSLSTTMEAVGLLRKVQVAYGKGSWPNIDDFLSRLDAQGTTVGVEP
ncbi:MAG: hypothetical protein ACK4FJ_16910 [Ferrovibrio sp.]|uniref:hypothetical protein n=1 Tax=Ferrovibrio sp. TaxID=1917215 RepID=UPI00391C030A